MGSVTEILLLSLGLAADAFAASVCFGLSLRKIKLRDAVSFGIWFGVFQALMPTLGYFLGNLFHGFIKGVDHWIAFILLCGIGVGMIREAISEGEEEGFGETRSFSEMLFLSVATSIDALAAGIALAMSDSYSIAISAASIGGVTFLLSAVGVYIGGIFGKKSRRAAGGVGGMILIFMGSKILFEHLTSQ